MSSQELNIPPQELVIPASKLNSISWFLYSLLISSCWASWAWGATADNRHSSFYFGLGILIAFLLSWNALYDFKKLFDSRRAIILNSEGITDNSGRRSFGFIPWSDVLTIIGQTYTNGGSKIFIYVKNLDKYLRREKQITRMIDKVFAKIFGTPIFIYSYEYSISHEELLATISKYHKKYGTHA